jgi:hypothetical protein
MFTWERRLRPFVSAAMPRFYLHVCNGNGFVEDNSGQEHNDLSAPREAAVVALRATLVEDVQAGNINVAAFVEIEDTDHRHVGTVHFSNAVEIRTKNKRKTSDLNG